MPMHHVHEQARKTAQERGEEIADFGLPILDWRSAVCVIRFQSKIRNPKSKMSSLALPPRLALVVHLRRDVEGRLAAADAAIALAAEALLADFHVDGDVELPAGGDEGFHVLARRHPVDGRAE